MSIATRNLSFALFACIVVSFEGLTANNSMASKAEATQTNFVMIVVDDLRPALGIYGDSKAYTPNIDALASQGITFKKAYANVPVCGASRASLLTGLRPTQHRFIDYKAMAETDAPGAKSLPQVLRENGYRTMAVGKIFHNAKDLADESWSEGVQTSGIAHTTSLSSTAFKPSKKVKTLANTNRIPWYEIADVEDEEYPDGKVKEKSLSALSFLANEKEPFFLSIGFIRPHLPFYAPKKYYDLHPRKKFTPFFHRTTPTDAPESLRGSGEIKTYSFRDYEYNDDEFHISSQHGYYASVSYIDALVGEVLAKLTSLGLRENTTIILLSDHGFHLGEHNFWTKHTLLDTALRIPLIISGPTIPVNQTSDALLELIDVFPTVLEIANIPQQINIDGMSFKDVIDKPALSHKQQIYSRFKTGDSIITQNSILTAYKLDSSEKEYMFYDLKKDAYETQNNFEDKRYNAHITKLKNMLKDCMEIYVCETY